MRSGGREKWVRMEVEGGFEVLTDARGHIEQPGKSKAVCSEVDGETQGISQHRRTSEMKQREYERLESGQVRIEECGRILLATLPKNPSAAGSG